ncbi:hypothetical protein MPER_03202, partial [Moniliophthora perniciosa FA553]
FPALEVTPQHAIPNWGVIYLDLKAIQERIDDFITVRERPLDGRIVGYYKGMLSGVALGVPHIVIAERVDLGLIVWPMSPVFLTNRGIGFNRNRTTSRMNELHCLLGTDTTRPTDTTLWYMDIPISHQFSLPGFLTALEESS